MRVTLAAIAFVASTLAKPMPQGVTSAIAPSGSAPAGCVGTQSGSFQITVVNATQNAKRSLEARQQAGILTLTLNNGILKDQAGRTGYVAANYQFQFDAPPQTGAIYTAGFSYCGNGTLAHGDSAIWYQCLSGDFFNLYDRHWAAQCSPVYIYAMGGSGGGASQKSDGQPNATPAPCIPVTQISDGQPQKPTGAPVSQISDGQPQKPTGGAPVTQISDGQPQKPTGGVPVSQISDGQPQKPTGGAPVTQISDGQPQKPTGAPAPTFCPAPAPSPPKVSQISDGQPQAPTGGKVSQISDGQPQAPRPTGGPVSQISDGQPQAPRPTGPPVSQISDGQPQVPTKAVPASQKSDGQVIVPSSAPPPVTQISDGQPQVPVPTASVSAKPSSFTGAAAYPTAGVGAAFAGVMGVFAML